METVARFFFGLEVFIVLVVLSPFSKTKKPISEAWLVALDIMTGEQDEN